MKRMMVLVGSVAVAAAIFAACGGDNSDDVQDTSDSGVVGSSGQVAADTYLEFDGTRYQLVEILIENLVDGDDFEEIGTATRADVDGPLEVYDGGDDDVVYTYAPADGADIGSWLKWEKVAS